MNLNQWKVTLRFSFCRYSSFLREHMRMPTKRCPMRMPSVDRLALPVRKEPLTAHSGPALQAVRWKSEHRSSVAELHVDFKNKAEMSGGATRGRCETTDSDLREVSRASHGFLGKADLSLSSAQACKTSTISTPTVLRWPWSWVVINSPLKMNCLSAGMKTTRL